LPPVFFVKEGRVALRCVRELLREGRNEELFTKVHDLFAKNIFSVFLGSRKNGLLPRSFAVHLVASFENSATIPVNIATIADRKTISPETTAIFEWV
jgi:hypothetical protein